MLSLASIQICLITEPNTMMVIDTRRPNDQFKSKRLEFAKLRC